MGPHYFKSGGPDSPHSRQTTSREKGRVNLHTLFLKDIWGIPLYTHARIPKASRFLLACLQTPLQISHGISKGGCSLFGSSCCHGPTGSIANLGIFGPSSGATNGPRPDEGPDLAGGSVASISHALCLLRLGLRSTSGAKLKEGATHVAKQQLAPQHIRATYEIRGQDWKPGADLKTSC